MSLIYLSGAWILGIWLGSRVSLPLALMAAGLTPLPFLFHYRNHRKAIVLASLCLLAFFGGAAYFPSNQTIIDESRLQSYNDRGTVGIRGTVNADPETSDKTKHLRLAATEIRVGDNWQPVSGTALFFVPGYASYAYGDVLTVTGRLQTPPQLSDFDYPGYLAHQGIYSTMLYPAIEVVAEGQGSRLLGWVYALRSRLSQTLAAILPEPQASLAQGIILGIRGNIPAAVSDAFSRTGTAHILAISGVNLTIVAGGLLAFGIWLFGRRRHIYVWLAFGLIWLYTLLAGLQPPVVRAAIIASLFFAAEALGRQRSAFTALAFAAAVMVGINPELLWDASFQLSFLAMAGLIFISPAFITLGRRAVNATLGEDGAVPRLASVVTDSFGVTLGAIIAVWPVVAHYFGIFSLVGLPATLLAMPVLPAIIVSGALAGGVGLIFLPMAQVIAWMAWLFLSYMLLVVQAFAAIPNAYIEVGAVGPSLLATYYVGLALVVWGYRQRALVTSVMSKAGGLMSGLPRKYVIPPLLIMAVLVWVAAATMPDDNTHISFLDVGEGDAALIQTSGQDILVDGGPGSRAVSFGLGQKMPFWDRTIELVILTHPHADHLTGLLEVVRRYQVKQVLLPQADYDSPLYREWLSLIREKNIRATLAEVGQQIDLGEGAIIEVVNTPTSGRDSDADNNGVVLRLVTGQVSALLTTDIQQATEGELLSQRAISASTILKVAHHGSNTSTSSEFLAVAGPQAAVISSGAENRFGHPSPEVVKRLEQQSEVYRTDRQGTIEFTTDGERLWVRTER